MTRGDKVVEVARDQVVEAAIAGTHAYEDGTTEDRSQAMLELRRSVRLLLELDARLAEPRWQGVGESLRGLWVRQEAS